MALKQQDSRDEIHVKLLSVSQNRAFLHVSSLWLAFDVSLTHKYICTQWVVEIIGASSFQWLCWCQFGQRFDTELLSRK